MEITLSAPVTHDELVDRLRNLNGLSASSPTPAPALALAPATAPTPQSLSQQSPPSQPINTRYSNQNQSQVYTWGNTQGWSNTQDYDRSGPLDQSRGQPGRGQSTSLQNGSHPRQTGDHMTDQGANGYHNVSSPVEHDSNFRPHVPNPYYASQERQPSRLPDRLVEHTTSQGDMTSGTTSQNGTAFIPVPQSLNPASPESRISPRPILRNGASYGDDGGSFPSPQRDTVSEWHVTYDDQHRSMDKRTVEDFAHSDSAEHSWGPQDRILHEGNAFSELERGWPIDSAGHGSLAPNRARDPRDPTGHSPLLPSPSQLSPLSSPPIPYNHRRISDISDYSRGIELRGKKPKHGRSVSVIEKGGVMYRLEPDDDVQVYGGGLRDKDKLDDSLYLYHSREYLEPATESDPLVNIRLVFIAHQLPRGADFARLVGPLRKEFTIDTYMIPHESVHVNDDDDVVLGLCGTLERICKGLRALLRSMVPRKDGFMIWRLCLLIPVRTIGCLIESSESTHDSTTQGHKVESSIPCLAKAMGCSYGPIPGARQECLFTIESCSVETIMGAVEYIGKSLIQTDDPNESCHGYYTGGQRSMLPRHVQLPWSLRHMAARMDQRVPASYILRPEMHGCLRHMQHKRFHLQFLLTVGQALELAGDSGVMFRTFSIPTDVMVSISDQIMSPIDEGIPPGNEIASSKDDILSKDGAKDEETLQKNSKDREVRLKDEFESSKERVILPKDISPGPTPRVVILSPKDEIRVCDVGANTLAHVEQSAVETIDWLRGMGLGKSSIAIYIPERAATRFKSRARGNFHFTVSALYDAEKQVRSITTRLEPDEKESILQIEGWDKTGIRHGVNIILDCIYSSDSNSSQN